MTVVNQNEDRPYAVADMSTRSLIGWVIVLCTLIALLAGCGAQIPEIEQVPLSPEQSAALDTDIPRGLEPGATTPASRGTDFVGAPLPEINNTEAPAAAVSAPVSPVTELPATQVVTETVQVASAEPVCGPGEELEGEFGCVAVQLPNEHDGGDFNTGTPADTYGDTTCPCEYVGPNEWLDTSIPDDVQEQNPDETIGRDLG